MAHWQRGETEVAREWYEKSEAWIPESGPYENEAIRIREEARAVFEADSVSVQSQ